MNFTYDDLLTYSDVEKIFNPKDERMLYFRKFWDSYKDSYMHDYQIESKDCCIVKIRQIFGSFYFEAKVLRPLGDFKDYGERIFDDLTIADIYSDWLERIMKVRNCNFKGYKSARYIDAMYWCYRNSLIKWNITDEKYDKEYFITGLCLMLYNAAGGVLKEIETINTCKQIFEESGLTVKAALPSDEYKDVDMKIFNHNLNKNFSVSIKQGGALSKSTISQKRSKGKTDPVFYCGFKDGKLVFKNTVGDDISLTDVFLILNER